MRPRAMMPRACGAFLCLMALAVAVAASNHPRNSRKSREALLDEDDILEKAALRTGESPREILRLLGRLAARRNGSPEAGLPRPLEDPGDLAFMERRYGSTGGRVDGGMQPQGHSQVEFPHDRDGGRLHSAGRRHDLDRLLRLSGFPAITKSGRRDHEDSKLGGSGLSEEEAILGFLEEVVAHRGSRKRRTNIVGGGGGAPPSSSSSSSSFSSSSSSSSALLPTPGPSPTPSPTPFPTPSRTMVETCGSCTWYRDTNGTLNIEGPEDCGSTCTTTSLDFAAKSIQSIGRGAFNRTGLSHVTRLYLYSNQISSLEAGAFAGLGNLEFLNLYGNQISSLEAGAFADLGNLTYLYLGSNGISSWEAGAFADLGNLKQLSLRENGISSWEAGAFASLGNLEWLDLGYNGISSWEAGAFADLGNLEELSLGGNEISSWEAGAFADLGNLERLSLDGNGISSWEAGAFADLGNLTYLNLYDNQISSWEAGAFSDLGNLERLDLYRNQISSWEAGAFADLGNLEELRLHDNQISSLEAGAFAGLGNLKQLSLSDNPLACKVSLPPSLTTTYLPYGYHNLPDCTTSQTSSSSHSSSSSSSHSSSSSSSSPTPPSTSLLPPWLADVAASGRFSDPSCTETRSMFDLVKLLRSDPGLYVSGGLRGLSTDVFGIWACIANHLCLLAVGAGSEDRMCYAVEQKANKHTVLHAWGLGSELNMASESCASNA